MNLLFNVTINDISVIYVTAHRCAGGLKKKFIHSDCESSPVKMAMPTGEHCWKKNSGAAGARTSNLRSFGFQVLRALHCAASEDL